MRNGREEKEILRLFVIHQFVILALKMLDVRIFDLTNCTSDPCLLFTSTCLFLFDIRPTLQLPAHLNV